MELFHKMFLQFQNDCSVTKNFVNDLCLTVYAMNKSPACSKANISTALKNAYFFEQFV